MRYRKGFDMGFFSQVSEIVIIEAGFFRRFHKLLMAAVFVSLIPAIYTLIYLSSVWDPASHTQSLSVALVNLDRDIEYKGQTFNVGKEVMSRLKANKAFGYQELSDENSVRRAVRNGKLAFALIIPSDFSSNAVPGAQQGGGKLTVYASEGNNYQIAHLARTFAEDLGRAVNDSLNERRWTLILAAGSDHNISRIREGVDNLLAGAHELEVATAKTDDGAQALSKGANALKSGHMQLKNGFEALQTGTQSLIKGVEDFRAEANESWLVPAQVVEGLDKVLEGSTALDEGLEEAGNAHDELAEGAKKLASGTGALADGTQKVRAGAQRLSVGIELLSNSLPSFMQRIEGSAEGMTHSVQPHVEVDAAVENQGSSFAPNVIPAALWLGAGIIAFLVHVRVLPNEAKSFSRSAQIVGKITVPSLIVLLQAFTVLISVQFLLKINIVHPMAFVATMAIASFTFLCIVFAMTRALGDAGKALAMLFLAVQLSSSGGVLPVELSGGFFSNISPWLPMTWVVKALKASMFGAYDDAWQLPLLLLLLGCIVAIIFASMLGRWRFVDTASVRPAVDF